MALLDTALTAAGVPALFLPSADRGTEAGAASAADGTEEPTSPRSLLSYQNASALSLTSAVDAAELLERLQRERAVFHALAQVRVRIICSERGGAPIPLTTIVLSLGRVGVGGGAQCQVDRLGQLVNFVLPPVDRTDGRNDLHSASLLAGALGSVGGPV